MIISGSVAEKPTKNPRDAEFIDVTHIKVHVLWKNRSQRSWRPQPVEQQRVSPADAVQKFSLCEHHASVVEEKAKTEERKLVARLRECLLESSLHGKDREAIRSNF